MFGPLTEKIDTADVHDACWYETVSMAILIILIALFGILPGIMLSAMGGG
jgi:NADH:ubiquinone oxidoreductase subunit 4 (subunit M)